MMKKALEGAAVSDFLYRIYAMQNVSSLVKALCDELPGLIPSDMATVGQYHADSRTVSSLCSTRPFACENFLPEAIADGVLALHPFWDHVLDPDLPLKIISDMVSLRTWKSHPFYRELLLDDGLIDHMNIELGDSPRSFTTVGVMRSLRGFSDTDRALFLMLKPHIVQAFRNARMVESLAPHVTSDSGPTTSILRVRCDGSLEDVPFRAARSNPVPKPVQRWIVEQVGWMNRGVADVGIPAYLWEDGKIRAEYRLSRQWGSEGYILSFRLLKDTPPKHLTAREQEVIHWVSEGKSNPEIAIILGISPHTIKDHLKQIYQKLEVENRTSAVRVWRDSASSTL